MISSRNFDLGGVLIHPGLMATLPITGAGLAGRVMMPSFDGLRQSPSVLRVCPMVTVCNAGLNRRSFRGLVVKAATTVAPKVIESLCLFAWSISYEV